MGEQSNNMASAVTEIECDSRRSRQGEQFAPSLLECLQGRLIVSCQPVVGGPMDLPDIVARQAHAACLGGAVAVRLLGAEAVAVTRQRCDVPIIGITKCDLADSDVRITPFIEDVDALVAAGADIVAFDATRRPRPVAVAQLIDRVKALGAIAMADCASPADAELAASLGADILATTLAGYAYETVSDQAAPDLELVSALASMDCFVIAEGRYHSPSAAAQAMRHGANAVVVGSAITRIEYIAQWFHNAIREHSDQSA